MDAAGTAWSRSEPEATSPWTPLDIGRDKPGPPGAPSARSPGRIMPDYEAALERDEPLPGGLSGPTYEPPPRPDCQL